MSNFNKDSIIYITPISKSNKFACDDYEAFKDEISKKGSSYWDNNWRNTIVKGCFFAFAVNIEKTPMVYVYEVIHVCNKKESLSKRKEKKWKRSEPYNKECINSPKNRLVIKLGNSCQKYKRNVVYDNLRKKDGEPYKPNWFLRGTMKIQNFLKYIKSEDTSSLQQKRNELEKGIQQKRNELEKEIQQKRNELEKEIQQKRNELEKI